MKTPQPPTYTSWAQMRQRCLNPNHKNFMDYGGRGITICARWDSFANFLADMGERPNPTLTLDRIAVNEGYSPNNCRWATRKDQSRNRRDTVMLTCHGVTKSLAEWADELQMKSLTIYMRLKRGSSIEEALTMKLSDGQKRRSNRYLTFEGKTLAIYEWAKLLGLPRKVLTLRVFNGWSTEKALTAPLTVRKRA